MTSSVTRCICRYERREGVKELNTETRRHREEKRELRREEDFNTENTEKTKGRESVLALFSVASVPSANSVLKSSSVAARGCAVLKSSPRLIRALRSRRRRPLSNALGLSLMLLLALSGPGLGETPVQRAPTQGKPAQAASAPQASALKTSSRRDPFKLPARALVGRGTAPPPRNVDAPPPGRRGLLIADLKLNGVVREEGSHSMIAVVTGKAKLAYFLRENDPVFDGKVVRITPNSIEFKQNYLDPDGQVQTRQVIKRLTSGEGK